MTPIDALEYVRSKRPRVLLAPSQWQAVQEYGKRKSEFPALQRCTLKCSPSSDAILITEADIQGYNTSDDCSKGQAIVLHCPAKVRPAVLSQLGSIIGDEVLITYEDLEGYDNIVDEVSKNRRFLKLPFRYDPKSPKPTTTTKLLRRGLAVEGIDGSSGYFIHIIGDAHVYKTHVRPLQEQLQKQPKPFPNLKINREKKDIDAFIASDFTLIGYDPHQKIEMKMAV